MVIVTRFLAIWMNGENVMVRDRMLQFFAFEHLRPDLQLVSRPFGELAQRIVEDIPMNPERTAGLRKLLEAKDCIVRATLYRDTDEVRTTPEPAGEQAGAQAPRENPVG